MYFQTIGMIRGDSKRTSLFFWLDPGGGGVKIFEFLRTFRDFFFRPKIQTFTWFVVDLNLKGIDKSEMVKTKDKEETSAK